MFAEPEPSAGMSPARVLIAEDEAPLREILSEGMRDEGFEVIAAADGVEALELYRIAGPFDVLLLDEDMPRLTGRRLLAQLRAAGETVPAVIFSGNLDISDEERARLGVAEALRKPVSLDDLSRAIRQAIERRG
jgi:CheY-like chemotaxis protein